MVRERKIGQFKVSPVGFGAMVLSMRSDGRPIPENPAATIHAALDAGITLIDTADIYAPSWDSMGHNERIIADALRTYDGDTSQVVVCTKAGITRLEGERWGRNGSPEYLRMRAERSIESLGVDQLDVFYLHRPDWTLLYSRSIEALAQLKADGLVKEVGISNASVEEIRIAMEVLGEGGLAAVQNEFSPWFHHTSRMEMELCGTAGIAFVAYAPFGGLTGSVRSLDRRFPTIRRAAADLGISPQRLTLAWEMSLGEHVIPIPGASRPESVTDSAKAMTDEVPQQVLDAITEEVF